MTTHLPSHSSMTSTLYLAIQYARRPRHWPIKKQWQQWIKSALDYQEAHITLRLVDSDEGQMLNQSYRGKNYATNILSFPYPELGNEESVYGDLVLCVPVVEKEASEQNKSLEAHAAHLIIHGTLHLQGYDHQNEEEALIMEEREIFLLSHLGYSNPYECDTQDIQSEESRLCRG